ncbi:MAG: hypothetical protein QNJ41_05780 [Xenococcaceae cyanobacterium MO_188.B32]|nr:hypothetical protein [Xenococcaceae cyanobacterium MO_188.B32]
MAKQTRHFSRSNLPRQLSALSPTYITDKLKLMASLNKSKSEIEVSLAFFNADLLERKLEVSP